MHVRHKSEQGVDWLKESANRFLATILGLAFASTSLAISSLNLELGDDELAFSEPIRGRLQALK